MTTQERINLYNSWLFESNNLNSLESAVKSETEKGNSVFDSLKHQDIEKAYEAADLAGWIKADEFYDQIPKQKQIVENLYQQLQNNPFPLTEFESCWQINHVIAKKVEVTFLDNSKLIGFVSPWEGDYSGPPYYFHNEQQQIYLDNGWNVQSVKLINN